MFFNFFKFFFLFWFLYIQVHIQLFWKLTMCKSYVPKQHKILLTSDRKCFQSVLFFHYTQNKSAFFVDKEVGGARVRGCCFKSL